MDLGALLRSPLSSLYLRPFFDRLAVPAIARLYLPLSRAWAAGLAADGDTDRLISLLPELSGRPRAAAKALRRLAPRAQAFAEATAAWEAAFFGTGQHGTAGLPRIEERRAIAAQALMVGRLAFLDAHLRAGFKPVAWSVAAPDEVARRHAQRLESPSARFPVPGEPASIEESQVVEGAGFRTQWLRLPTMVGTNPDTLWARVERPDDDGRHPVLIFTHGICVETEFLHEVGGPAEELAASGLAMVRPEGPFHGRRRVSGSYGGEPVLALGPMGFLDYYEAHVRELGLLTDWARRTFGGPVAVGGVSLGALVAQLVASAACHWPAPMRPDAIFLVTASDSMLTMAMEGSLPSALGAPQALADHGWSRDTLEEWQPLLDPGDRPAVAPHKVVMVLGRRDEVTPYPQGERLVRRWGVPVENVFLRDLGHFTASLSLYRDPGPFERLRAVMDAA